MGSWQIPPPDDLFPKLLGIGKRVEFEAGETICYQDDRCNHVYYIEDGLIKLTALSRRGRAAVLGFLARADFFGESCLAGRARYQFTSLAMAPTSVISVKARAMMGLIERDPATAAHFVHHLLLRTRRMEQDLLEHMFNTSEQRLARTLLWLWKSSKRPEMPSILDAINQDTLADMVGTTRPRVNFFMNKFRKMGMIDYDEAIGLIVHPSLQNFVQQEFAESD